MRKYHSLAVAAVLTAATFFNMAACQTPATQQTPIAPMPAPAPVNVTLAGNYAALVARDFGDHSEQLDAIQKEIAGTPKEKYADIELQLLGVLQNKDAAVAAKMFALDMLRIVGGKTSIPTAASLLADEKLSHNARRVLAGMNNADANAALREGLAHTTGDLRIGIINTLGDLRDEKAVKAISDTFAEQDAATAIAAYNAFAKIGTPKAWSALNDWKIPPGAKDAYYDAQLHLLELFNDQNKADVGGSRIEWSFLELVHDAQAPSAVRGAALVSYAKHEKEKAIPEVLKQLSAADSVIRRAAGSAAINIPGNAATLALAGQLADAKTKEEKISLLAILSSRADSKGITPQIHELASEKNSDTDVRLAAVAALSTLGDETSVPVLTAALKTAGPLNSAAWQTLAELDSPAVTAALVKEIHSSDNAVRAAVINALAEKHVAAVLPEVRAAAKEEDPMIRDTATKALGVLGDIDDFKSLLPRTRVDRRESETNIVIDALSAIAKRNDKEKNTLIDLVVEAQKDADNGKLFSVLAALGGDKSMRAIAANLTHSNVEIRKSAARVLGNWQGAGPLNDLLKAAKTDADEGVKILALQGFIKMAGNNGNPGEKIGRLRTAFETAARPDEKRRAIAGLGNVPTAESLKAIEGLLADETVKGEAFAAYEKVAETLAKSNPRAARPALEKTAAEAPDPKLRERAKRAAEEMK